MIVIGGTLLRVGAGAAWSQFRWLQVAAIAASAFPAFVAAMNVLAPGAHMSDAGVLRLALAGLAMAFGVAAVLLARHTQGAEAA